jgi:mono/diheme cytochrome c family protein
VPPNVQAALRRKRMPIWAAVTLAVGLPLWGYAYAGTLEPPTVETQTALDIGGEIYGKCASCHGAGGEGISGPALDTVGQTFGDPTDHAKWVFLGSDGWSSEVGDTYGDQNTPIGGGGMPAWGTALTPDELVSVIAYERSEFGELDVVAEGLVDEEGNLLVEYDADQGILVDIATGEPADITPEG